MALPVLIFSAILFVSAITYGTASDVILNYNITSVGTTDSALGSTGGFPEAFGNSFAMIIVTELGDKTFFIAALMAMRHDRSSVLLGAVSALAVMTVLSAIIGLALPSLLPRQYTHWAATALFVYFGFCQVHEAWGMFRSGRGAGTSGELEDVEQSLKDDPRGSKSVVLQALTLTFLAEWGDRSQIATIALAAARNPIGVMLGGTAGHISCSSVAVLGGCALAQHISERAILAAGGALFLAFGVHGALMGSP